VQGFTQIPIEWFLEIDNYFEENLISYKKPHECMFTAVLLKQNLYKLT